MIAGGYELYYVARLENGQTTSSTLFTLVEISYTQESTQSTADKTYAPYSSATYLTYRQV